MKSPTAVLTLTDATWTALTAVYDVDDAPEVRAILAEHPSLPDLLLEIREAVRRYFGDDAMTLRISLDPEWDEAEPELVAAIRTHREGREAVNRLERFNRDWWLPRLAESRAPVFVTIYLV